ncbi:hypothetical protein D7294_03620 [Streptomyces hoynatensis]|uniref:Uncharacterized protein n=1 Tax=Streptomyces hoynatensis TaxID=1141874 RepID=A0A3A9ZB79_9ACTN|nr:hypothetical protein D7294_03620 [Streptomyces hoynatensis]
MPVSHPNARLTVHGRRLHLANHLRCHTALDGQPPIGRVNSAPGQDRQRSASVAQSRPRIRASVACSVVSLR